MNPLTQFSSPAYLTDFTPENAKRWSTDFISRHLTLESQRPQVSQFYNEVTDSWPGTRTPVDIIWAAFPNSVQGSGKRRWILADERGTQDEYCEWSVLRNDSGKITRVIFTAEGPEYWDWLGKMQPETVLQLYKEHNPGFDIKKDDLFPGGTYKRDNKWNNSTTPGCIMHLIHCNNTLTAQIHIAGQSTVLRIDSQGNPIRAPDRLLRCSRLGLASRNSDPYIGIGINNLAHSQHLITVADPIGLYLHDFNGSSFHAPDGADVNKFWKFTRGTLADPKKGTGEHWVRAVFEVPKERDYVVGDIEDQSGEKIQWGSQLADFVQVRLTGQAIRAGLHTADAHHCIANMEPYVDEEGHECNRASGIANPS
ncbi:hypothetical protein Q9L58_009748 [Maublancomyces gigas]|uniref:Uncharacterized protein n=1 Tax=Discina gigas TaxID=1032678 RepID=A0ABR3G605_9PEZI